MTGNANDGGGLVSQADLTGFRQDTADETAQFQSVRQKAMDDFVDATRQPASGEGANGASGLGLLSGGSAAEGRLPSKGSAGSSLPGKPISGGPSGVDELGQAVGSLDGLLAGAPPPTSGAAGYTGDGTMDAYPGRPRLPYPGQASGLGGGYRYGSRHGGASALLGPAGGIAAGPGGEVGYRGALAGAGTTGSLVGQPGGFTVGNMGVVGDGSAWGGARAIGASFGQMDGGALGGAGVTGALYGQGAWGGVGHGGSVGGARIPSAPNYYGQPGRFAVGGQVGWLAVGLGGGSQPRRRQEWYRSYRRPLRPARRARHRPWDGIRTQRSPGRCRSYRRATGGTRPGSA